jgi:hypothetical protein
LANKLRSAQLDTSSINEENTAPRLTIEPYQSLDDREAFQQQFTVANLDSYPIYELRYGCAVSSIQLKDGKVDPLMQTGARILFVPIMHSIRTLSPNGKTNTDCDYFVRYGSDLESASIELIAVFRKGPDDPELTVSQGFTGRRDSSERFVWTFGSADQSILQSPVPPKPKCVVVVVPFGGENRHLGGDLATEDLMEQIKFWSGLIHETGCKAVLSTMISGKYD